MSLHAITRCSKCKSMNGSLDISTGNFKCQDCGENKAAVKFDYDEYISELNEKEKERYFGKK
jgi:PHP family Zn ribbon phosphoesterase